MQTLQPNTSLQGGKYVIQRVLGQGGFGVTYLAKRQIFDDYVAIKEFFFQDLCSRSTTDDATMTVGSSSRSPMVASFKQKFLKEAKTIHDLDHANIVRVFDVFEENNTAYYVMEYIDGESLAVQVKNRGALPESEAISYIKQVGAALSYLHDRHINHLDVKPANIMIRRSDNQAILIDFGTSKVHDAVTGDPTTTTPVGVSHGYAPIEQYRDGGVKQFSPQADIYSLGATLYKLVTGQTPPDALEVATNGLPQIPASVSRTVKTAIDASMSLKKEDRPQKISSFLSIIEAAPNNNRNNGKADSKTPPQKESARSTFGWIAAAAAIAIPCFIVSNNSGESNARVNLAVQEEPSSRPTTGYENGHEWVDLGLPSGTKWATMNVGASSPSDYGSYFAWGETRAKNNYTWETLKYRISGDRYDNVKVSKYVTDSQYGPMDGKRELDLSDDAAYVNWGSGWRMPTKAQLAELFEKCSWTRTTMDGHNGCRVVGPNGNFIFLPAAGYRDYGGLSLAGSGGYYWSSSLNTSVSSVAYCLFFNSGGRDTRNDNRYYGRSVRPVCQ